MNTTNYIPRYLVSMYLKNGKREEKHGLEVFHARSSDAASGLQRGL